MKKFLWACAVRRRHYGHVGVMKNHFSGLSACARRRMIFNMLIQEAMSGQLNLFR